MSKKILDPENEDAECCIAWRYPGRPGRRSAAAIAAAHPAVSPDAPRPLPADIGFGPG
ncbi:hypothetical protein ABXK61_14980 [Burkholderia sola]|uniref:hypothetical protein n=1 Tax=Burkholderia TaxID=32008 RepID=UPI001AE1BFBC|nr:hypothetical protein [Burkholderia sp. AcTa6-5]MBP0714612.1 hypothetical protein [Burkholderia sp. AcTa6-5]